MARFTIWLVSPYVTLLGVFEVLCQGKVRDSLINHVRCLPTTVASALASGPPKKMSMRLLISIFPLMPRDSLPSSRGQRLDGFYPKRKRRKKHTAVILSRMAELKTRYTRIV
ncbi:hypothetical protein BJ878DRAFT_224889 [Calycina marina]|uniref:Secreted protein n=1 Tax=Calycina marina TaxID=1763456 RepID=A0A9P7YYB4_9HELO|nr:hypothetical protein BJ878DRAFT_224889 [Calycina marina]